MFSKKKRIIALHVISNHCDAVIIYCMLIAYVTPITIFLGISMVRLMITDHKT